MIECITPRIISSTAWGTAAKARDLSLGKSFSCAMIAPDSEASAVELRPSGISELDQRILISRENPYFGPIEGKWELHPVVECPADSVPGAVYSHQMKLMLYPSPPPIFSNRRAPARYRFAADNGETGSGADIVFPLIPAFGRTNAFFNLRARIFSGDVDLTVEGGRVTSQTVDDPTRFTERWEPPAGLSGSDWLDEFAVVDWSTLNTESAVAATTDFFYQYSGDFDFYRVTATRNSGFYNAQMSAVLVDE